MNSKLYWVEYMKAVAILAVIVIHVTAPTLIDFHKEGLNNWTVFNFYNSISRFCVPVFLMISGALILSKDYASLKDYFRHRFSRIFYPFLFWGVIFIVWNIYFISLKSQLTVLDIFKLIFLNFRDGIYYHFWFVYLIIGLYLFYPIARIWLKNADQKNIRFYLIIWLIVSFFALPAINKIRPGINMAYFSGYLGYPVLGYYLMNYTLNFKSWNEKRIGYLMVVFGTTFTFFGTQFLTLLKNEFDGNLYHYLMLNVIITSAGIFMIFKNLNPMVGIISKYSYGIYLCHVIFLIIIKHMKIDWTTINPIIGIPLVSITVLFASTALVWLINKLPFGKYISS